MSATNVCVWGGGPDRTKSATNETVCQQNMTKAHSCRMTTRQSMSMPRLGNAEMAGADDALKVADLSQLQREYRHMELNRQARAVLTLTEVHHVVLANFPFG